jgi:signal transduction histidine kinase
MWPRRQPPTIGDVNTRRVASEALAWIAALAVPAIVIATVPHRTGQVALGALVAVAASTLTYGLLRRRPLPALVVLLFAWFLEVDSAHSWAALVASILVTALAVGYLAATASRRVSIAGAVLAVLAQLTTANTIAFGENSLPALALVLLSMLTAWLAGNSVRESRRHAASLHAETAARAVTAERLRIARELHDVVAHSIGIIAIQAGAGARVIGTQPAEARNALSAIEATSRETLSGLRRMLTALRESEHAPLQPMPGLADIDRLAAATGEAGVQVDVRWRGERRPLPPEVDLAAYRIIQEALTNVVRHAGTDRCRVLIDVGDAEVRVEVIDDGRGGAGAPGFGLTGMRERVGLVHGELTIGPGPHGGYCVDARLPIPAGIP